LHLIIVVELFLSEMFFLGEETSRNRWVRVQKRISFLCVALEKLQRRTDPFPFVIAR
jgi:hypothetical protein